MSRMLNRRGQLVREASKHQQGLREIGLVTVGVLIGCIGAGLFQGEVGVDSWLGSAAELSNAGTTSISSTSNDGKEEGWNPIHVFYGKMNHLWDPIPTDWYLRQDGDRHLSGKKWFAQHGQDVAVAQFFDMKSDGYFVDLASNDAVWASNTFFLEHNYNWKGICIEANPTYWYRLSFRTNCHVVGSIVGGANFDEVHVSLPNDPRAKGPFGGIVGKEFDNKQKNKQSEARYTASLVGILKKFNAPQTIDYLSLDVEGAELFIMKDFPFHKPYTFKLLSIERPKDQLKEILEKNGYKHILDFKRGDTLWAHTSVYDEGKARLETPVAKQAIDKHEFATWPPPGMPGAAATS